MKILQASRSASFTRLVCYFQDWRMRMRESIFKPYVSLQYRRQPQNASQGKGSWV
jgi:hypothetical protein